MSEPSGQNPDRNQGQSPIDHQEGAFNEDYVHALIEAIAGVDRQSVHDLVASLHTADMADLLELLNPNQRQLLITLLGDEFDFETLREVEDPVRDEIVDRLPAEQLAQAVQRLDSDDAVHLLEDLDEGEQQEILEHVPEIERQALKRSLDYPEDSAGRLMQFEFVAVPPFWTVGQAIDHLRDSEDLPDEFYEIFIIDPSHRLLGTVALNHLLRTRLPVRIEEIMNPKQTLIRVTEDQEDVAYKFEQYNLISAAVIDADRRLVGAITIDDVVDIIQEEAREDILHLGGVGDESLADKVIEITRSRFVWLLVNLATAITASMVIAAFDATIEQMVSLAILMPIVASMGGNAGTQTMTVAVRALATRDLTHMNALRVITRETLVGFLNGCLFAVIMGTFAALWFNNMGLGGVIAAAMMINMIIAGSFGILIPLSLDQFDIDPAIASSVFVTMVTDVVGFFAFLSLAAWLLF